MPNQGSTLEMSAIQTISRRDKNYPPALRDRLGKSAPEKLYIIGDVTVLKQSIVAFVCSVKCPGSVVIHTFDAIRELRDAGVVVVGGFHSPMEQECLEFLLRGKQPVIMSPAKGLSRPRFSTIQREAIEDGRLTLVSMFPETDTRTNKKQSQFRNEFVAALSESALIPYASPGGNAELIAHQILERGQPLYTILDLENDVLINLGAKPYNYHQLQAIRNRRDRQLKFDLAKQQAKGASAKRS